MPNKNAKIYLVIFIIIALLLLTGIIYWYFWWGKTKTKVSTTPTPSASAPKSQSASPSADPYAGWKKFDNSSYDYSLYYPSSATLDVGTLGCVTINTEYGHVIIRGKGYEKMCGRTGVGSDYTEINETIVVKGKSYNSTGYKSISLNPYNEFLMFTLDDGNSVDYGMDDFNLDSANPAYDKVKAEIKKIVESYQ